MTDEHTVQQVVLFLRALPMWEHAAIFAEKISGHFQGGERLSVQEWEKLKGWSERWNRLPEQHRKFYAKLAHENETVSVALWKVLQGTPLLADWQYRNLSEAWEKLFGMPPSAELAPRL
jgi:hypothetical protein